MNKIFSLLARYWYFLKATLNRGNYFDKKLIDHLYSKKNDINDFRFFLKQLHETNHRIEKGIFQKISLEQIESKEKLFCLDCFIILHNPSQIDIAKTFENLFDGRYQCEISLSEAQMISNLLTFSSRIFIEERNHVFKKLKKN
jgi:hypothetical protein